MKQNFKIMDAFAKLIDLIVLNFLFVLTSLPVITLGASLTALFSVSLKLCKDEESYITRDYFRAFKENFAPASGAFLIFLLAGGLLGANILISMEAAGTFYLVIRALSTIFLFGIGICFLYFFPVLARFRFTPKQILQHIPHMIVTQPGFFFLLVLMNGPVLFLCLYSVYTAFFVLLLGCIVGFALFTYVECVVFRKIFTPYELSDVKESC